MKEGRKEELLGKRERDEECTARHERRRNREERRNKREVHGSWRKKKKREMLSNKRNVSRNRSAAQCGTRSEKWE